MSSDFNPMSVDSQFATIVERLKQQDKERWEYQQVEKDYRDSVSTKLDRIQAAVDKTNGRVTALENEQWRQRGFAAALALGASAAWQWITHSK